MADPVADEAAAALAALDRALAHRPDRDGEAFAEATQHLCRMRDLLIAERRAGQRSEPHLSRLNAVISSAQAGHFPLGATPWPVVETAQSALRAIVADLPEG